jgi:hypothetical protein
MDIKTIRELNEANKRLTIDDIKKYANRIKSCEMILSQSEALTPKERKMHAIKADAYRQVVTFIEFGTPELA